MQREFEVIFKSYYSPVKSFLRKLVKTEDDAEDIAQDVFTQLWVKPEVWKGNRDIDRYIFRMAKYQALNLLRNNARIADQVLVDADMSLMEKSPTGIQPSTPSYTTKPTCCCAWHLTACLPNVAKSSP